MPRRRARAIPSPRRDAARRPRPAASPPAMIVALSSGARRSSSGGGVFVSVNSQAPIRMPTATASIAGRVGRRRRTRRARSRRRRAPGGPRSPRRGGARPSRPSACRGRRAGSAAGPCAPPTRWKSLVAAGAEVAAGERPRERAAEGGVERGERARTPWRRRGGRWRASARRATRGRPGARKDEAALAELRTKYGGRDGAAGHRERRS